jgi:hypothetical protein
MKRHALDPLHLDKLRDRKRRGLNGLVPAPFRKPWWPTEYFDYRYSCRDCGKLSVWTAEAQQTYLERWDKSPYHITVRCADCQRVRRQKIKENNRRTAEGLLRKQAKLS